jgi:hypothetical protein
MGRPMAILRMGARVPDAGAPDAAFMYGSPVLVKWRPYGARAAVPAGPLARARDIPRQPVRAASAARVPIFRGEP